MPRTVLVVEDEILVRYDTCDFLRAAGYRVLEASTAQQAIDILQGNPAIDLVFTDVQMPGGLNGIDLANYVCREHPGIKIVVTSGHISHTDLPQGLGHLVEKPYRLSRVLQLLQEAMN